MSPLPSPLYTVEDPHPEGWPTQAVVKFRERMLDSDNPFPCIFGVDAMRRGMLRFAFLPAGPERYAELAKVLTEFVNVARNVGSRPSLVCLFEHDESLVTMDDYRAVFWALLVSLHKDDPSEWPSEIPTDPDSPTWEFSFGGISFFVVANTPLHVNRRSRQMEWFTVTFQPRFGFDTLSPDQDTKARKIIRERLITYDKLPPSPFLGHYGDTPEWRQYFLEDHNDWPPDRCPFHTAQKAPVRPQEGP